MRSLSLRHVLRSTAAVGAIALGSSAANAACTTADGVVTCTGANTTNDVNIASDRAPGPSVSVIIAPDATVSPGFLNSISLNGRQFPGAIGYVNDGSVGSTAANVDFQFNGDINNTIDPANTFTFDNRGTQNGGILAFGVGGAISGVNTGTVTRAIDIRGAGPISFINTGRVFTTDFFSQDAVLLVSLQEVRATGPNNFERRTDTGAQVTAVINGLVAAPATTANDAPRPQGVLAIGVGGADVTVNGTAGTVTARARAFTSEFQQGFSSSGSVSASSSLFDIRTGGGNARAVVAAGGQASNLRVESGPGVAVAVVNGTVGDFTTTASPTLGGTVSAIASGTVETSRGGSVSMSGPGSFFESTSSGAITTSGGAASVEVASTGRASGSVTAFSNAGAATVTVAGQVGTAASFGSVEATATGVSSTRIDRSTNLSDGSFRSTNASTQALSRGAALVTVAPTGQVLGNVNASGDVSATIDNSGRIGRFGTSSAQSNRSLFTASNGSFARTIVTDEAGVRTQVDRRDGSFTEQSLGGVASVTNRLGGAIQGSLFVDGLGSATFTNAGSIESGVNLVSRGNRRDDVSSSTTTTTRTPAADGSATTVVATESTNNETRRATGGAVTGIYSGIVGAAPPADSFASVNQSGSTASTATVTGTLYADLSGTAGAQNSDSSNSFTSRQTTLPSGASTREETSASRTTTTQIASTSSLTVAPTGRILVNALGEGDASLTSQGSNATFTLDGGRVDGSVDVDAGTGLNLVQTSDFAATFTRAAAVPGTFVPEVQQSQTSNNTLERRSAAGTATATINGGTIGGDLAVSGSGTGEGSLGANVVVNGTLTGSLGAFAFDNDLRTTNSDVRTRTGPGTVTRTTTNTASTLPSTTRGGVLVNVGGTVGGQIAAGADIGSATINLTGRANALIEEGDEPNAIFVQSFDFLNNSETIRTSAGSDFFFQPTTSSRTTSTSNATGGTATFNIAANAAVRAANLSSAEGDIFVQGFAGSALNVAAGSRILQTTGELLVGASFTNGTTTTVATFTNGVQTGSSGTSTSTAAPLRGPASVNNAGTIGSAANFVTVNVTNTGGANVVNTGTINGAIAATARGANRSTTTETTDFSDFLLRRVVATNALTATGGAVRVDNAGLVTGGVSAIGATGTVTNTGVVRGTVTLGGGFNNFTTTVTTTTTPGTDTMPPMAVAVSAPSVANATRFTQNYTLNQNGLLIGGVATTGTTTVDPSGATVRTGNVNAQVNLNEGSVTFGNIAGGANTATNVALNGTGFLGFAGSDTSSSPAPGRISTTAFAPAPSFARFAAIDPTVNFAAVPLPSGSRVSGVQTLTKAGPGTFVITGAPLLPAVGAGTPSYTLDVGTLRVAGGELQLGLAGATAAANSFGIRGNVENNANLVVGRRITDGTQTAIQGINVSVLGNVVNGAAGNLVVGVNPTLVRGAPAAGGDPFGTTPASFVAFGPNAPGLASTNSFVRVDGNLNLGGTIEVQTNPNGLYEAGRAYDLFSVGGTVANTATLRSSFASPFVGFTLTPRSEGGRTILSLNVIRADFDTVATDDNAAAAAGALQANLAGAFAGVRAGNNADAQDLAGIISALDTRLNAAQAQQLFSELSSGEFYGSLSALSTTAPFGEATDGLPLAEGSPAVGLWFRPTGQFAKYKANEDAGASGFDANNYGGSLGVNFNTGGGGHIGLAGGYGKIDADSAASEEAEADTWMVGFYGVQQLGRLHVSGQAVYGKTEWDVVRTLPLLRRTAESSFDSDEVRANLRVAYTVAPLPGLDISPFAKVEARRYEFDAFTETGAGAVSLTVGKRAKTIVSPEVGVRMAGVLGARLRPFAEGSYVFQGDVGSDRTMAFVGGRAANFTTIGVDPEDSIKGAIGVAADVAGGTVFLRGDYASGGQQQVGSVRGGLLFSF